MPWLAEAKMHGPVNINQTKRMKVKHGVFAQNYQKQGLNQYHAYYMYTYMYLYCTCDSPAHACVFECGILIISNSGIRSFCYHELICQKATNAHVRVHVNVIKWLDSLQDVYMYMYCWTKVLLNRNKKVLHQHPAT